MNPLSLTAMHSTFRCQGGSEAVGTSFLYEHVDGLWLVTAAHNVTSRHAITHAPLGCPATDRPVTVTVRYAVQGETQEDVPGLSKGSRVYLFRELTLSLYDDDGNGTWLHHPKGSAIDIAAIRVVESPDWCHVPVTDRERLGSDPVPWDSGQPAYILGFPLPGERRLPICKYATVASEPLLGQERYYWVDSASRPGMSGGPVFIAHHGYLATKPDESDGRFGSFSEFAGIYVGRVDDDTNAAQIGKVFKPAAIEEVLESGVYWTPDSGFLSD